MAELHLIQLKVSALIVKEELIMCFNFVGQIFAKTFLWYILAWLSQQQLVEVIVKLVL